MTNSSHLLPTHHILGAPPGPLYTQLHLTPFNSWMISAQLSSFQPLSHVQHLATPQTAARQAALSITKLLESTQTHVHWVCDAIQSSHPLLSPSPPALNPSQHQGLFKWVSSSHEVAKVLEFQLWSPCSPRDSQESSPKPQFKSINSSALRWKWKRRVKKVA